MSDFNKYVNNNNSQNNDNTNKNGKQNKNETTDINQTINTAKMLASAFNGKSESNIYQMIIAQAEQGKRNGTLTNADLDNFYATLSPMLDQSKRKKLEKIITKLKEI
jgi:hypothetical protein